MQIRYGVILGMKELLIRKLDIYGRKKTALLLSLILLLTCAVGYTAAYLIGETDPVLNTFISGVDPYGSLTISKSVEHPYGDSYVIPEDVSFSYKVELGDKCAGKTYSGYTADSDGVITLDIPYGKGTSSIKLEEIPAGTHAVITEQSIPKGFEAKDGAKKEVDIEQAKDKRADYVNVYTPDPADNKVKVTGSKTLEGRDWKDSDEFKFVLEQLTGEEWVQVGTEKTATKESKTFSFSGDFQTLVFDEIGTYKFRVKEIEGSISGVTYDSTVNYFNVIVTDEDMDGSLEINGAMSGSPNVSITTDAETKQPVIDISFNNSYAPTGSDEVILNITKTMKDTSGQGIEPAGYSFKLYDGSTLITETDETDASGIVQIKQIFTPADIGEYRWTLKETKGSKPGVIYDETEYDLAVKVVDNGDGTISAYVYDYKPDQEDIPSGASNTYDASFENPYDPDDAKVCLEGSKKLTGRTMKDGEFKFDLYETDSTFDTKDLKPEKTAVNKGKNGSFSFDLSFSKVGTFFYAIKEDSSAKLGGITYDTSEYHVKVVVIDNGGVLEAETTVTDASGKAADVSFKNMYAPSPAKLNINGVKILKGRTLGDGEFRFGLYESDSSFSKEKAIGEAVNSKTGTFSFNDITYDKEGTFYYIVRELSDKPVENVKYDKSVYHVTVSVKDDKEGKYVAETKIETEGTSSDKISFTNTYTKPKDADDKDKNKDDKSGKKKSVKTGDYSGLLAWVVMMLLSMEGLTIVFIILKRRERKNH